jgi:FkbM family methyltransferase
MSRLVKQFSNDLTFALSLIRRRSLYLLQSINVNANEGVIRESVRVGRARCHVSFRYKSFGDRHVVDQIFQHLEYAIDEHGAHGAALRAYFNSIIARGKKPLILDAGANIGASSLYFSCVYPGSLIVAIEPERNNCALLKHNLKDVSAHVMEGAIGAEEGTIFVQDPGLSDWGFRVAGTGVYPVPVFTPNGILASFSERNFVPLLFKIDIEGFEEQLFSKNLQWLDKFPMIVIELHDWMLPGSNSSRAFLHAIAERYFDFLHVGENVFCFNTKLLTVVKPE